MPDRTVTHLRPRAVPRYTDTAALLTTQDPGEGTLADIAQILARAT
jgi:hypothetical protein